VLQVRNYSPLSRGHVRQVKRTERNTTRMSTKSYPNFILYNSIVVSYNLIKQCLINSRSCRLADKLSDRWSINAHVLWVTSVMSHNKGAVCHKWWGTEAKRASLRHVVIHHNVWPKTDVFCPPPALVANCVCFKDPPPWLMHERLDLIASKWIYKTSET